jgi:hypothetical protein
LRPGHVLERWVKPVHELLGGHLPKRGRFAELLRVRRRPLRAKRGVRGLRRLSRGLVLRFGRHQPDPVRGRVLLLGSKPDLQRLRRGPVLFPERVRPVHELPWRDVPGACRGDELRELPSR